MADIQQSEQSQCFDVSRLLRAEIVPENAGNSSLTPPSENFDKEVFLEEVRKYRCLSCLHVGRQQRRLRNAK
jgi:hypothetical protein